MPPTVVGLSHKTAPLLIRERVAFTEAELPPALAALRGIPGIDECLLLSTCNRTEVYLSTASGPPVEAVVSTLGALKQCPAPALMPYLAVRCGTQAARHVLRVAAGLESMAVGEAQILGQVRRAYEAAREARVTGSLLNRLMQVAIATGRRVRRGTGLWRKEVSIPRAALALCAQTWGSVNSRRILIIGAGEMAAAALKLFAGAGAQIAAVVNRTPRHARPLASHAGAAVASLDAIATHLSAADAVIACVGADGPVLTVPMLQAAGGRSHPLLLIDLGVPRAIEAAAAGLPGVALHDLDALGGAVAPPPQEAIERAGRIVEESLQRFGRWQASRAAEPIISALRDRAERLVDGEFARMRSRLNGLDPRDEEAVRTMLRAVVHKLLHVPTVRLRESAAAGRDQVLAAARELFDLEVEEPQVTRSTRLPDASLVARAEQVLPGGVNSPVRAFRAVGGRPVMLVEGRGARVTDVDGRVYVDYIGSWGALILGHAPQPVVDAVARAAASGTSFGLTTPSEVELAELIRDAFPSMQLMRFVNSGTEATMSALRVARGFTGRQKIVKFAGCYHGHADLLLAQAGSGMATFGLASSAGVPAAAVADTIVVPYNDLEAVRVAFGVHRREIAAVIVEPVAANMGVVRPRPGFLEGLREITARDGALLIFDEVITGFRLGRGGAQAAFGIAPDLTCLGKIAGGGLPLAVYGGRQDIMERLAPLGPVYQAGTLAGNPVAVASGLATLRELSRPGFYERLEQITQQLVTGLADAAKAAGVEASVPREASMLAVFFTPSPPADDAEVSRTDRARFRRFFHAMLDRGVLLPPSPFEAWFVSAAHSTADIQQTVDAAREAFEAARGADQ